MSAPDDRVVRDLISRCALFTGLAVLVPVPFLDDILVGRSRAHLVAGLLKLHGRDTDPRRLRPLWSGGGCLSGCLLFPLKLIIWPLKKLLKTLFFVLTLRSAALQIGRTMALGRQVDRQLRAGKLAPSAATPPDPLTAEATRARVAFDLAYAGIDRVVLLRALEVAFRGVLDLPRVATGLARRVLRRDAGDEDAAVAALPPEERQAVASAADRLEAVLDDPAVRTVLEGLDRRFDEHLRALEAAPR